MTKKKLASLIVAVLIGAAVIIYGGYDDSPGAQLLGLILIVVSIVVSFKNKKK